MGTIIERALRDIDRPFFRINKIMLIIISKASNGTSREADGSAVSLQRDLIRHLAFPVKEDAVFKYQLCFAFYRSLEMNDLVFIFHN